jgi:hypothetical protein
VDVRLPFPYYNSSSTARVAGAPQLLTKIHKRQLLWRLASTMFRPALLATLLFSSVESTASYSCADDGDCEFNGSCHMATCACASGWTGPSCGELNFAPVPSLATAELWPTAAAISAGSASAWGFSTPLFDAADNLYHAFSTVACGKDGVVGSGGGDSFIVHLVSATPDGGWSLRSAFTPQTTFGPMSARALDGTFVVIFRVNLLLNTSACAGNNTDPMPPSFLANSEIPASDLVSGDPEAGTSIYVASAARATGPWTVDRINITGAGDIHKSNPAITQLPDGRWAMAYRYNPKGGSLNAVALADSFKGPYNCIANLTEGMGGDEDPFFFYSNETAGDPPLPTGVLLGHMIYHNHNFGYHAFGKLDGSPWRVSPTHSHAFTLNVTAEDGSTTYLARRERPALRFDEATQKPVALINGVQNASASCFSFEQPLVVSP